MTEHTEPTEEGKLRYPAYIDDQVSPAVAYPAGFNHSFMPPVPCTCMPVCQPRCAGECGCQACRLAFSEYANMRGWYGPKDNPQGPSLDEQLAEFRRVLGPAKRP